MRFDRFKFYRPFKPKENLKITKKRKSFLTKEGFVTVSAFYFGWVCVLQPTVNSDIKMTLHLSDAYLGTILFALPVRTVNDVFQKIVTDLESSYQCFINNVCFCLSNK
jgi:hypothetical protein